MKNQNRKRVEDSTEKKKVKEDKGFETLNSANEEGKHKKGGRQDGTRNWSDAEVYSILLDAVEEICPGGSDTWDLVYSCWSEIAKFDEVEKNIDSINAKIEEKLVSENEKLDKLIGDLIQQFKWKVIENNS